MTTATVTCPNGHRNPEHHHFRGECRAAMAPATIQCLAGHANPAHQRFCGE
jgi:hypothetical protein